MRRGVCVYVCVKDNKRIYLSVYGYFVLKHMMPLTTHDTLKLKRRFLEDYLYYLDQETDNPQE